MCSILIARYGSSYCSRAAHTNSVSSMARTPLMRPASAARVPIASRPPTSVLSPHRRRKASAPRAVAIDDNEPVLPPEDRLQEALEDCLRLDCELQVIENSGHARLGEFAKALGSQQACKLIADGAKLDTEEHLPVDPLSDTTIIEDDDVTNDPFFHRFYDEAGQSTYEQLLRGRTRVLVLTKLVQSRKSLSYIRAEVDLAETYARMNLWKQAHSHVMVAHELLKELDTASTNDRSPQDSTSAFALFVRLLEYCYDRQLAAEPQGEVVISELGSVMDEWTAALDSSDKLQFGSIFKLSNLALIVGSVPSLHWQQLLLRVERQSVLYQEFIRETEARVRRPLLTHLQQLFAQLDPSRFGVVPVRSLVQALAGITSVDDSLALPLSSVREAIEAHDSRVRYPSITWSELLYTAVTSLRLDSASTAGPTRETKIRLKFFFGRFCLRKGQLEDAMRYLTAAIADEERLHGFESQALVLMYLAIAETLGVRYKQHAVVAQQQAFQVADKWLKSAEGAQRIRAKAMEMIDSVARTQGTVLARKDAEVQAREELIKEYAALSLVRPDATAIEDAIEYCTKAWRLQELVYGADHVTTARVHIALAQLQSIKQDWDESVRCYEKAIQVYVAACNGPVPASAWLRLEVAKLHQFQRNEPREAARGYEEVGAFFHSFAMEFASTTSTRRDCCVQAIEAYRMWVALSTSATMEEQKQVLSNIYDATVDGYGEFAVETADRASELGRFLVQMGQLRHATRYLRTAWYILESHYGPHDRRSRKARKELLELNSELQGAALDDGDDGHHWLTL